MSVPRFIRFRDKGSVVLCLPPWKATNLTVLPIEAPDLLP